jgi:hypothetical protein
MISAWKALQVKYPRMYWALQAGIDKLETYEERLHVSDAYILAMCKLRSMLQMFADFSLCVIGFDPSVKLKWVRDHHGHIEEARAKRVFIDTVNSYCWLQYLRLN